MSIRTKILIPMIILIMLVSAGILMSNIFLFSNYVDSSTVTQINTASNVATYEFETRKSQAQVSSLNIADDPTVIYSIETGNREALLARAIELQNDFGVEFMTITDASGMVLARSHEPEKFGDSITSQANIRSAISGTPLTLIEQGTAVPLSIRSGAPIYSGDQVVGVVSSGFRLDTSDFVDSIKALLNCEVTIFLGDTRISTTVLKDDGTRATGTQADPIVSAQVLSGMPYEGNAQILGNEALTKYTPIYGSGSEVLGMLFVGQYLEEEMKTTNAFLRTGLLITLALLIISIVVIFLIVRRIVTPINLMVQAAHSLADGDTELSLQIQTKDEMRELSQAFNAIIENTQNQVHIIEAIANGDLSVSIAERSGKDVMNQALKTMLHLNNNVFSQIIDSATHVSSAARQMADSSQNLAQGATEQAATVHQLSTSIMEVSAKTKANADMADKAASLAREIEGIAQKGSGQMGNMVQAVKEINDASNQIGQIIKVIDDIAFQTNILALNAAVEAARAGQHGKGFAVVAEEVRNLAAKSAQAAKNTGSLIENSMVKAELGVQIADETEKSLAEIISGINKSSLIVDEIAKSSAQQTEVISQVSGGINQVTEVVQQNSAVAQESAAISAEMNDQANLLQDLVARFKLKR